jgi:hypothetical protein
MNWISALLILTAIGAVACGSVGPAQLPLSEKPIEFVDATTGASVERVLIIPQYSVSSGVSTGAGHGPGAMAETSFIAFPIVYRTGELLKVRQPDSKGLLLPGVFVGRGVSVEGVTVLAPGYLGAWFHKLWERPSGLKVPLTAMTEGWDAHRDRLIEHLSRARIRGRELNRLESELLNVSPELSIEVRLEEGDRQRIRDLLGGPVVR